MLVNGAPAKISKRIPTSELLATITTALLSWKSPQATRDTKGRCAANAKASRVRFELAIDYIQLSIFAILTMMFLKILPLTTSIAKWMVILHVGSTYYPPDAAAIAP